MERHEIDNELTQAGARDLLASAQLARLAYIGQDGTPRVIPLGFFWTGEEIVVSTAPTSPKVSALTARPEVAVTIDAGATPEQARTLSVRGRADIRIVDGVTDEYLAGARKVMDPETATAFEENVRQMYDRMARIAITPTWARYFDFRTGRFPRFLHDLAEEAQRRSFT